MKRVGLVMVTSVLGYVVMVTGLLLIGRVVTFPDEEKALTPADGGIGAATHMLVGRHGGTDFLVDYASAWALLHHRDAYALSADTTAAVGEPWAISGANPHPPTPQGAADARHQTSDQFRSATTRSPGPPPQHAQRW